MEGRGQINCYRDAKTYGQYVYTINLAAGTTPFIKFFDGNEYRSCCYVLPAVHFKNLTIGYGWYRPTKEGFDKLRDDSKDHVLHGGLLESPLADAIDRQLPGDTVTDSMPWEQLQAFFLKVYGVKVDR